MNIVALIPARGGSKRIPGKNIKMLGGKPLLQWTIEAARESGIFSSIVVSTENPAIGRFAIEQKASWCERHVAHAGDESPDICWVREAMECLCYDAFAILRPTSPFRTADTIRRAWRQFQERPEYSLRAVQPVREHPGKMWRLFHCDGTLMTPVLRCDCQPAEHWDGPLAGVPWHSSPTQSLPDVFVQNASLEMSATDVVTKHGAIATEYLVPFFTEGWEGFDINTPEDWDRAERHLADLQATAATQ